MKDYPSPSPRSSGQSFYEIPKWIDWVIAVHGEEYLRELIGV